MSYTACCIMSCFLKKKCVQINSKMMDSSSKQTWFCYTLWQLRQSDIVSSALHAPSHMFFVTHFISTTASIVLQSTTVWRDVNWKARNSYCVVRGKNKFISNSCFCLLSSLSKDFEAILGERYFSCFLWRQKINTTFFTLVITLLILIPILTCFQLVITVGKAIHKGREVGCDYIQNYVTSSLKAVLVGWNNQ